MTRSIGRRWKCWELRGEQKNCFSHSMHNCNEEWLFWIFLSVPVKTIMNKTCIKNKAEVMLWPNFLVFLTCFISMSVPKFWSNLGPTKIKKQQRTTKYLPVRCSSDQRSGNKVDRSSLLYITVRTPIRHDWLQRMTTDTWRL
jgi:hypothetical protein